MVRPCSRELSLVCSTWVMMLIAPHVAFSAFTGITQEEKVSTVSIFYAMTTSLYPSKLDSPMFWSPTIVAAALHTDKRWATLAFAQDITKASISLSFMMFMMWLIVGVPKIMGILFRKFNKSGTTRAIWSSL